MRYIEKEVLAFRSCLQGNEIYASVKEDLKELEYAISEAESVEREAERIASMARDKMNEASKECQSYVQEKKFIRAELGNTPSSIENEFFVPAKREPHEPPVMQRHVVFVSNPKYEKLKLQEEEFERKHQLACNRYDSYNRLESEAYEIARKYRKIAQGLSIELSCAEREILDALKNSLQKIVKKVDRATAVASDIYKVRINCTGPRARYIERMD